MFCSHGITLTLLSFGQSRDQIPSLSEYDGKFDHRSGSTFYLRVDFECRVNTRVKFTRVSKIKTIASAQK